VKIQQKKKKLKFGYISEEKRRKKSVKNTNKKNIFFSLVVVNIKSKFNLVEI